MPATIRLHDGSVDPATREVRRGDLVVTLRGKEAELLAYMAERPGRTVPRTELFEQVWGYHPETRSRTLDTTVRRIRSAIEADPGTPRHLLTEVGVGYRFVPVGRGGNRALAFLEAGVADLAERLTPGLHTLWGPPGIGKSRWGHRLAELTGGTFVARATLPQIALALALDDSPAGLADRIGHWLNNTSGWLVLDDPEPNVVAAAETWTGARVVVCQRVRPRQHGRVAHAVPPLPPSAAQDLFAQRARVDDPVDLSALAGIPLAIELAAAIADIVGVDGVLQRLAVAPGQVLDGPGGGILEGAVAQAVDALAPNTRRALAAVCWLGAPSHPEDAALAAGGLRAIASLMDHGLLVRTAEGQLVVPLRDRVATWCPITDSEAARVDGLLAARCGACMDPLLGTRSEAERATVLRMLPIIDRGNAGPVELLRARVVFGADPEILRADNGTLADPVLWARWAKGPVPERLAVIDAEPDSPGRSAVRARLLRQAGRAREALASVPPDDLHGVVAGEWAMQIAMAHFHSRDPDQALHWGQRAVREWSDYPRLALFGEAALADVYFTRGQNAQAAAIYDRMLAGPLPMQVEGRMGLAMIALSRGSMDGAREGALTCIPDLPRLRPALAKSAAHHVAMVLREVGDLAQAEAVLLDALTGWDPSTAPYLRPVLTAMLGTVHLDGEAYGESIAILDRAAIDLAEHGLQEVAEITRGRAAAARELLDLPDAEAHWREAIARSTRGRAALWIRAMAPGAQEQDLGAALELGISSADLALQSVVAELRGPSAALPRFSEGRLAWRLARHRASAGHLGQKSGSPNPAMSSG